MPSLKKFAPALLALSLVGGLAAGAARAALDIPALTAQSIKSLVQVEYTFRNENVSREESGQGLVLNSDGVILIAGQLIPEQLPKEWIKDIKVRLPGKQFTTIPATFWGRTTSRMFAYVKVDKFAADAGATPLSTDSSDETKLGQQVIAIAFYPKGGGYTPYTGFGRVRSILPLSHNMARVETFGLTRATSPVYDFDSGKLLGLTFPAMAESMSISLGDGGGAGNISIKDDDQSAVFLPWSEVKPVLTNIPTAPLDSRRPWMGVDGLTGLEEEVRTLYAIDQPSGITVGSSIPGMPADQAGLKSRDIILSIDGKQFSTSPVPEYMVMHFQRALEEAKIGQEIKLAVLRDGKKMDVTVKMAESPKIAADMPHTYNTKLGITTRDLVFSDNYARKLPADQKGVMVALVKQGAPAALGTTPLRGGLLITRVNDQEVENQKQFEELIKAAAEAEDKKEVVFRVIRTDGETQVCRIDLTK